MVIFQFAMLVYQRVNIFSKHANWTFWRRHGGQLRSAAQDDQSLPQVRMLCLSKREMTGRISWHEVGHPKLVIKENDGTHSQKFPYSFLSFSTHISSKFAQQRMWIGPCTSRASGTSPMRMLQRKSHPRVSDESFVAAYGFVGCISMFFSLRIAAYDRFLMIVCICLYDVWISWNPPVPPSKKGIGSDVTKLYGSLEVHSLNPNINELPATQVLRPSPQGTREWPAICSICLGVSELFIFVDSFGIFSWKAWSWQDAKIRSIRLFLKGGTPIPCGLSSIFSIKIAIII